jgi:hypothetical protein
LANTNIVVYEIRVDSEFKESLEVSTDDLSILSEKLEEYEKKYPQSEIMIVDEVYKN